MKASMMDRRSFLAGALALVASPSAAFAQERSFAQDLQGAGFEFHRGNVDCMLGFLLVYIGIPEQRNNISCGDDLTWIKLTTETLQEQGLPVTPVFLFREGTGYNLDEYIDVPDSPFVALSAKQDDFVTYVHGQRLGFIQTDSSNAIINHTQNVILMNELGDIIPVAGRKGVPASFDFRVDQAKAIHAHMLPDQERPYCEV